MAINRLTAFDQPAAGGIARIVCIAETHTRYISGFTAAVPWDSAHWKEAGPVLARYDNWKSGTPTMQYAISLPWSTQTSPQVTPA